MANIGVLTVQTHRIPSAMTRYFLGLGPTDDANFSTNIDLLPKAALLFSLCEWPIRVNEIIVIRYISR